MIGHRHPLLRETMRAEAPSEPGAQDEHASAPDAEGGAEARSTGGPATRRWRGQGPGPGWPGGPPWMRGRRFGRRGRRRLMPLVLMAAIAMAVRRARESRRPAQRVFVGMVFRPVTIVNVSVLGGREHRARRRTRGGPLARLLRRS